ncbi:ABC transporter permease [Calycomorphotria hydatis]|uniref:Bicarbonate transport system permease protein CmpB n=1 Tax=Calycomorphotria hydatis TaxID=2528027 RepID=A0A517T7K7_9PLAN|nr:ABC transporter permease [Calycomorphotria hydatis]QDT64357.1 Bicarbonate transport system permease protein CmpB [Calycomorphotria hydatis]
MKQFLRFILYSALPPALVFAFLIVVWDRAVVWLGIRPYVLPRPSAVAQTFADRPLDFLYATLLTFFAAVAGFLICLICGIAVSLVFAQSRWLRSAFYPYAIFLQTVPIIAIAPLLLLWIGYGLQSVIAVSVVVSIFPIIANTTAGLIQIPAPYRELFGLYHANRWQMLWKLRFPHAVPAMVTGAKTSSGLAVIGAIVGEFFAGYGNGNMGLGYLIRANVDQSRMADAFAAVFLSTLLGVVIFAVVSGIGTLLLYKYSPETIAS